MRWVRTGEAWALTGILDWDLASAWDPALNPAYLSLWHGEEKLEAIARDPAEARRARAWLGWMALEGLDDAASREGTGFEANWPKLLRKVLPRIGGPWRRCVHRTGRWVPGEGRRRPRGPGPRRPMTAALEAGGKQMDADRFLSRLSLLRGEAGARV